jgi:hypothetical protein
MADETYTPKVYHKQGGDELVVASGGKITVESGGAIEAPGGATALPAGIRRPVIVTDAATLALEAEQSGAVIRATKTSATQTFALPAPTTAGLEYTFICGHADGEINIDPGAATYTITGVGIAVAAAKDLKNSAASNVVGDSVTLVSDGDKGWHITAIQGTWAST